MARQLRHHCAGGWYHSTARGGGRRERFEGDREQFGDLLAAIVQQLEQRRK